MVEHATAKTYRKFINKIKSVRVLVSDCKKCHTLKADTDAALKKLGLNIEAEYVTDIQKNNVL